MAYFIGRKVFFLLPWPDLTWPATWPHLWPDLQPDLWPVTCVLDPPATVVCRARSMTLFQCAPMRALCDTCHKRVESTWKKKSSFAISANLLLKRRHPLSPLTLSQGDAQTACHIDKKKGYRIIIPYENVQMYQLSQFHHPLWCLVLVS